VRRISSAVAGIGLAAALVVGGAIAPASATTMQTLDNVGWDIYSAPPGANYRYGPSSIINADNTIDQWTAGPGAGGAWDYIYYRRSVDGGHSWSDGVAMTPTAGSRDAFSVCDPGVIKLGSYYYIGYTSTENPSGRQNHLYVARSTSPSGGFEKWNGSGWGGSNPQPIVTYTGGADGFGVGEPSFVERDGTLFIYYSWNTATANETRVATASATNANWPAAMTQRGVAIHRELSEDSADVKYVDSLGKFYAVTVSDRLQEGSFVTAWESTDGLTFAPSTFSNVDGQAFSHNIGISGTANGHLDTSKANFVAFAYGPNWASWNTHLSPISFSGQQVGVSYHVHQQGTGWTPNVIESRVSGQRGAGLRVEAVQLSLTNPTPGMSVQYQAHVQDVGWQSWVGEGAVAGTTGESKRMEAVKFLLSGTVPAGYHIKYRVYQNGGWGSWSVDGQQAGVTGQSALIEAVQVFVYRS
jgi:hypothetical protein